MLDRRRDARTRLAVTREEVMTVADIFWLIFLLSAFQPVLHQRILLAWRIQAVRRLEKERGSRVVTLIHRQETLSILGLRLARYIDIDDSEEVVRAIELTDRNLPIDLVLHTPGGLVLAAEQIAHARQRHPAKVTVMVPHYAMSGGTLIALAADEIMLAPSAVLGPVDPQIGQHPAVSVLAAVDRKDVNKTDDETLILADMSRKALGHIRDTVADLLVGNGMPAEPAQQLARILADDRWTHDYPITVDLARKLGLRVSPDVPDTVREIIRLYPQPRGRRPSVEYVPVPYTHPGGSSGGRRKPGGAA
jgi:ClpP class serine protease